MSSTTRCPFCETRFRVVPDQLRISGGWVRCGKCGELFHAISCLQSDEDVLEDAPPSLQAAAEGDVTAQESDGSGAGLHAEEPGAVAADSAGAQAGSSPSTPWPSRSRQQKHIPEFLRAPVSVSTHVVLQDAVQAAAPVPVPVQANTSPHDESQVDTTTPAPAPEAQPPGANLSPPQAEKPFIISVEPLSPDMFAMGRPLTGRAAPPTSPTPPASPAPPAPQQDHPLPEDSDQPPFSEPDQAEASSAGVADEPVQDEHEKSTKTPAGDAPPPDPVVPELKITAQAGVVGKARAQEPSFLPGSGEFKVSSVLGELRSDGFRTRAFDADLPPDDEEADRQAFTAQPQASGITGVEPDSGDDAADNLLAPPAQAENTDPDDEAGGFLDGLEIEEEIDFSLDELEGDSPLEASPAEVQTDVQASDFSSSAPMLLTPSVPTIPGGYELPAPTWPLSDDEDPFPEFGFDDLAPVTARQMLMESSPRHLVDSDSIAPGEYPALESIPGLQEKRGAASAVSGEDDSASPHLRSRRDAVRDSGAQGRAKKNAAHQGQAEQEEPVSARYLTPADDGEQEDDSGPSSWPGEGERRSRLARRRSGNTRFPETRSAQRRSSGSTRFPEGRSARRRGANTRFPEEDAALERDRRRLARSRSRLKRSGGSVPAAGSDWDTGAESSAPLQAADVDSSSFMRRAKRREFWQQTRVRAFLALLLVLLAVLLALQVVVHERDALAASRPGMRPALEALCRPLGCTVSPLKQLSAIRIDSDSFNEQQPGIYVATIMLKNTSDTDVAMPAIELALSDINGLVVVRRVLTPADLGAPAVLPARGEWQKSQYIRVPDAENLPRFTGYEFSPFYPS